MWVVSYDISSDRLRSQIAKTLEGYGQRIQYSVFECRINHKKYEELYNKLRKMMADAEEEGNIRFYYICGNCEEKIHTIGKIPIELKKLMENVIVV